MKKQYILFDFDGVIVNTEPQNAHYLQETLKSFGVYFVIIKVCIHQQSADIARKQVLNLLCFYVVSPLNFNICGQSRIHS